MVTSLGTANAPAPPQLKPDEPLGFGYRGLKPHNHDRWQDLWFMASGELGFDTETISLDNRKPLCIGLATNPAESYYFRIDSPVLPWHILRNPQITKVLHNSGFDLGVFWDFCGVNVEGVVDTIHAAQILGYPAKLKDLVKVLFDKELVEVTDLIGPKGKGQLTMDKVGEKQVAEKVMQDCEVTIAVWWALRDRVPRKALGLETRMIPLLQRMHRKGMLIDREALAKHRERVTREVRFYRGIAKAWGFNPGSSLQLAAVLQSRGWHIQYNRKTKKPILNEDILKEVYANDPMAHLALLYRKANVLLSTYINKIDTVHLGPDGRIHPNYNLGIASTGRLTHSKPNSANIPELMRDIILPTDGFYFEDEDLSQIELRALGYLVWQFTGDRAMMDVVNSGADIHQEVANLVNCTRRIAKDINFAVTYGGDAYTLYKKDGVPLDQGEAYIYSYFQRFPGVRTLILQTHQTLWEKGYSETLLGRRRVFYEKLVAPEVWKHREAEREAFNNRVQGSAAEILKEWQLRLDDAEPEYEQVNSVHDEVLREVELGRTPKRDAHLDLAPFPTPIDAKVGHNWRDVVKVFRG